MQIRIPKITLDAFEIWGDEKLEQELEQQESAVKMVWSNIYNTIASGKSRIAYWDDSAVDRGDYRSFMRYALHCSTKKDGFLQLSVMEIRNGEIIPTSDSQHDSADDFISRRAWTFGTAVVTLMS